VAGAAERLNVSGKTVRRLVKADIIPFARIGTRL
jgi:excisionase family DNA binding protein